MPPLARQLSNITSSRITTCRDVHRLLIEQATRPEFSAPQGNRDRRLIAETVNVIGRLELSDIAVHAPAVMGTQKDCSARRQAARLKPCQGFQQVRADQRRLLARFGLDKPHRVCHGALALSLRKTDAE